MVLMSLCRDPYVVLVNYDLINSLTPTFLHAVGAVRRAMAAMRKKPRALDGHSVVAPLALAKALAAVPPSRRGGRVSNLSIKTHDRLAHSLVMNTGQETNDDARLMAAYELYRATDKNICGGPARHHTEAHAQVAHSISMPFAFHQNRSRLSPAPDAIWSSVLRPLTAHL